MKATGIVRRIDDLGRVVIPKEIRRTMRIREGDPLEIFTDRDGEVIFKKYSPIGELGTFSAQYAETLYKTCGITVIITDRDSVIAVSGISKKEYMDRSLSDELEDIMNGRSIFLAKSGDSVPPLKDRCDTVVNCAMPIITNGDVVGCVVSLANEESHAAPTDVEVKLIQTAASFLSKQLEG